MPRVWRVVGTCCTRSPTKPARRTLARPASPLPPPPPPRPLLPLRRMARQSAAAPRLSQTVMAAAALPRLSWPVGAPPPNNKVPWAPLSTSAPGAAGQQWSPRPMLWLVPHVGLPRCCGLVLTPRVLLRRSPGALRSGVCLCVCLWPWHSLLPVHASQYAEPVLV